MIDEPGWTAGSVISAMPVRGPLDSRRRSLASWIRLSAAPRSAAEKATKSSRRLRRLDEVVGGAERHAGKLRERVDHPRRIARVGVQAGAGGGAADVEGARLFERPLDALRAPCAP